MEGVKQGPGHVIWQNYFRPPIFHLAWHSLQFAPTARRALPRPATLNPEPRPASSGTDRHTSGFPIEGENPGRARIGIAQAILDDVDGVPSAGLFGKGAHAGIFFLRQANGL
jgi:hypothetical protein